MEQRHTHAHTQSHNGGGRSRQRRREAVLGTGVRLWGSHSEGRGPKPEQRDQAPGDRGPSGRAQGPSHFLGKPSQATGTLSGLLKQRPMWGHHSSRLGPSSTDHSGSGKEAGGHKGHQQVLSCLGRRSSLRQALTLPSPDTGLV